VFILFVLSPLVRLLLVYDGPPKRGEFAKYLVKIYSVEDVSENIWLYLFLSLFIGEVVCFFGEKFLYSIYKNVKNFLELEEDTPSIICKKHPNYCIGLAEGYYSLSKAMAGFSVSLLLGILVYFVISIFPSKEAEMIVSIIVFVLMLLIIPPLILHLNTKAWKLLLLILTIFIGLYYTLKYNFAFLILAVLVSLVLYKYIEERYIEKNAILIIIVSYLLVAFLYVFVAPIYTSYTFNKHGPEEIILFLASYIMMSSFLAFFIYRRKYEELIRATYRKTNLKRKH